MKNVTMFVVALLIVAMPAAALDIHIDYDRWARFSTYKTIAWMDSEDTSVLDTSELMHNRMKLLIMNQMTAGRLTEDTEDPDLYVTYHTSEEEALQVNTHSWGYAYPSNWYWDPYWRGAHSTTMVSTYTQGTLIVDIWNAREKTLVWRGTAVGLVSKTPEKDAKQIEKALKKMAKKWNKMKPGF